MLCPPPTIKPAGVASTAFSQRDDTAPERSPIWYQVTASEDPQTPDSEPAESRSWPTAMYSLPSWVTPQNKAARLVSFRVQD